MITVPKRTFILHTTNKETGFVEEREFNSEEEMQLVVLLRRLDFDKFEIQKELDFCISKNTVTDVLNKFKNIYKELNPCFMCTNTSGYSLFTLNDITTHVFITLCENLEKEFNIYYKTDCFKFGPEKIYEGGILFLNFPNKTQEMYKTMRIYVEEDSESAQDRESDKWPFIEDNTINKWKLNKPQKLISKGRKVGTRLKSFERAPIWTKEELKLFQICFNQIGIDIIKSSYPKIKNLSYSSK